jgi:transcription elongation factor GreA
VEDHGGDDEVTMNKSVEVYFPDDDETETYRIVTTIRGNSLKGLISIDSPLGKALLHHKVGDTVAVHVNKTTSYEVEIRSISAAADEEEDEIRKF